VSVKIILLNYNCILR